MIKGMRQFLSKKIVVYSAVLTSFFTVMAIFCFTPTAVFAANSCPAPQVSCSGVYYDPVNGSCTTPYCTSDQECVSLFGTGSQCLTFQDGCSNTCTLGSKTGTAGVVTPTSTNATTATFAINGSFYVGGSWQLTATGPANTSFTLCAQQSGEPQSCTPDFASTDATGGWSILGTFQSADVGSWNESITFDDAAQESASIQFSVSSSTTSNNNTSGSSAPAVPGSASYTGGRVPDVPYLDGFVNQSADLNAFIDSNAFEGVYWYSLPSTGAVNGGTSGSYATQATANALCAAFGCSAVITEPTPPSADPFGYFLAPDGTENPPQWFLQFSDGAELNAGTAAMDYYTGGVDQDVAQEEALADTAHSFTESPDGSPITWQLDPSDDYLYWVGTDAQGYTWQTGGPNCSLVAWAQYGMAIKANPAPYATQSTANSLTNMNCTVGTSGSGQSSSGVTGGSTGNSTGASTGSASGVSTGSSLGGSTAPLPTVSQALQSIETSLSEIHAVSTTTGESTVDTTASSNQNILTVLQQSLQSILSSLAANNNTLSSATLTSVTDVVNSIQQIIQSLEGQQATQ